MGKKFNDEWTELTCAHHSMTSRRRTQVKKDDFSSYLGASAAAVTARHIGRKPCTQRRNVLASWLGRRPL